MGGGFIDAARAELIALEDQIRSNLRSRPTPWTFRQPVMTRKGWAHPLVEVHVAPDTSAELNELMREHYLNDTHDLPPYAEVHP